MTFPIVKSSDEIVKEALNEIVDEVISNNEINNIKEVKKDNKFDDTETEIHNELVKCDEIFSRIHELSREYNNDVDNLKTEIYILQNRSITFGKHLSEHDAKTKEFALLLEDIQTTEPLITTILRLNASDKLFLTSLKALSNKLKLLNENRERSKIDITKDVLQNLKNDAMEKIMDYIFEVLVELYRNMSKIVVTQKKLLICKYHYEFLLTHNNLKAEIILNRYKSLAQYIYFVSFEYFNIPYLAQQEGIINKVNLISDKTIGTPKRFTIGKRNYVLEGIETQAVKLKLNTKPEDYQYEVLFRNIQHAVLDHSLREYSFLRDYFLLQDQQAFDVFYKIMGKALDQLKLKAKMYLALCSDCITLLLCFHLTKQFKFVCHKKDFNILDEYWEYLEKISFDNLSKMIQENINSINEYDVGTFNLEPGPHYISVVYAQLYTSFFKVNDEYPDERVINLLKALSNAVETLLKKISLVFQLRKEQLLFLINNFDFILNLMLEIMPEDHKEVEHYRSDLVAMTAQFVNEILSNFFKDTINFVLEWENYYARNKTEEIKAMEEKSVNVVKKFDNDWKYFLERIHLDILVSFTNPITAAKIHSLAFMEFTKHFNKFYKILTPSVRIQSICVSEIIEEIEKYGLKVKELMLENKV